MLLVAKQFFFPSNGGSLPCCPFSYMRVPYSGTIRMLVTAVTSDISHLSPIILGIGNND